MILYNQKHDIAMTEEDWAECLLAGSYKDVDMKDLVNVTYNPMTGEWEEVE